MTSNAVGGHNQGKSGSSNAVGGHNEDEEVSANAVGGHKGPAKPRNFTRGRESGGTDRRKQKHISAAERFGSGDVQKKGEE